MRSKEEILWGIAKRIIECQKGCYENVKHNIYLDDTQWDDLEDEWHDYIESEFDAYAKEVLRGGLPTDSFWC